VGGVRRPPVQAAAAKTVILVDQRGGHARGFELVADESGQTITGEATCH
jgi:hypothetical protein